jgi:hypothetical protein
VGADPRGWLAADTLVSNPILLLTAVSGLADSVTSVMVKKRSNRNNSVVGFCKGKGMGYPAVHISDPGLFMLAMTMTLTMAV